MKWLSLPGVSCSRTFQESLEWVACPGCHPKSTASEAWCWAPFPRPQARDHTQGTQGLGGYRAFPAPLWHKFLLPGPAPRRQHCVPRVPKGCLISDHSFLQQTFHRHLACTKPRADYLTVTVELWLSSEPSLSSNSAARLCNPRRRTCSSLSLVSLVAHPRLLWWWCASSRSRRARQAQHPRDPQSRLTLSGSLRSSRGDTWKLTDPRSQISVAARAWTTPPRPPPRSAVANLSFGCRRRSSYRRLPGGGQCQS